MSEQDNNKALKQLLREKAHQKRAALTPAFRDKAAFAAAKTFLAAVPLKQDQIISLYWGIRDELSTKPLLTRLIDMGHQVCLPVVKGREEPLEFRLWKQGEPLAPSGFGTMAPQLGAPVVTPDIMILPMLGFDRAGNRLGYGAGYYDRTIDGVEKPLTLVGYAFAAQELDSLPTEPHDVPLDMVVTEAGAKRLRNEEAVS